MHRAAPAAAAANPSRAAGTAAPVWREKPRLTLPQQGTGMRWGLSLSGGKTETSPLSQSAYVGLAGLPKPSLVVAHLSSSWRKITGPLLETWEALS